MTVSVIMPVYKVEEYVGKAIESLQGQTYTDWELWAVDDGSPDRSGEVLDAYAAKDGRIHVIHKENGGAPSARNTAIPKAQGKYLYFMDADDWAEPDMLKDMVALAEANAAQLVVAGFYIDTYYSDTEKYTQVQRQPSEVFPSQRAFREEAYRLFDRNLLYTPWNKLYLASYIREKGIEFPTTLWDDFPFNLLVVRDVERVCVTEKAYYHFIRKRAESETAKYNPRMYEKREEEHGWMTGLYRYWQVDDEKSREMIARRYAERLIGCVENVTNPKCTLSRKEKYEAIRQMIQGKNCRDSLPLVKPRSGMMKAMLLPMRMQAAWLSYLEGTVISHVKTTNTKKFAALKANR